MKLKIYFSILFIISICYSSALSQGDNIKRIDSLKKLIIEQPRDTSLARTYFNLSAVFMDVNADSASHYYYKSLNLADELEFNELKSWLFTNKLFNYIQTN